MSGSTEGSEDDGPYWKTVRTLLLKGDTQERMSHRSTPPKRGNKRGHFPFTVVFLSNTRSGRGVSKRLNNPVFDDIPDITLYLQDLPDT